MAAEAASLSGRARSFIRQRPFATLATAGAASATAGSIIASRMKRRDEEFSARDELNSIISFARGDYAVDIMKKTMGGMHPTQSAKFSFLNDLRKAKLPGAKGGEAQKDSSNQCAAWRALRCGKGQKFTE